MIHYLVHDSAGNILRTGTCPKSMAELQAGKGEVVVTGLQADDSKHTYNLATKRLNKKPPPAPPSSAELWARVRAKRDVLLSATDWTQLPDAPAAIKLKWTGYRQALRDIPQKQTNPTAIAWPPEPK